MTIEADAKEREGERDPAEGKGQPVDEGRRTDLAEHGQTDEGAETGEAAVDPSPVRQGRGTRSAARAKGTAAVTGEDQGQDEDEDRDEDRDENEDEDEDPDDEDAGADRAGGNGPWDDDPPNDTLLAITESVARAEAMKPLAGPTEDLHSTSPDKRKAREAVVAAYRKLAGPTGELRVKWEQADTKFGRAAADMKRRLPDWIERCLRDPNGAIRKLLAERRQVAGRLRGASGKRELTLADAQTDTKRWADRYSDWSSPGDKMNAQIAQYANRIDKLNADINNEINVDQAIFTFWFDVAPKHLQLSETPLDESRYAGLRRLRRALGRYPDVAGKLASGSERGDGSLFLIDPDQLDAKRREVLTDWGNAAEDQAKAEAQFKLRPDAAAALKTRHDKVAGDAWIKEAMPLLQQDPAA